MSNIVARVVCLCGLSFLVGCETVGHDSSAESTYLQMDDVIDNTGEGARGKIEAMSLYSQAVLEAKTQGEVSDEVENKLFEVIARDPDAAEPYSVLLDKWNKSISRPDYIKRLQSIFEKQPQSIRLALVLVSLLEKEKRYDEVISTYEQCYAAVVYKPELQKKSGQGELWRIFVNGIVNAYRRDRRFADAERVLGELNYDDGVLFDYVAVRYYLSVIRELHTNSTLISKEKKSEYESQINQRFVHAQTMLEKKHYPMKIVTPLVEMLILNNDFEDADAVVAKNIENNPDDVQAYIYRAVMLDRFKKTEEAFAVWKTLAGRSLKAKEQFFVRIINASIKAEEYAYPLELIAEKLKKDPEDKEALFQKARVYCRKRAYVEALSYVDQLPELPVALLLGSEINEALEKWSEAVEYLERYKKIPRKKELPKDFFFYHASICVKAGDWDRCDSLFEELLTLYPKDAQVLNYIGYTWCDNNKNLEQALDYILSAVTSETKNVAYIDSLLWVYYRLGRYEDARGVAEAVFERNLKIDDAVIYDHIGEVYSALDLDDKAREMWRKALETKSQEADFDAIKKKLGITEKRSE